VEYADRPTDGQLRLTHGSLTNLADKTGKATSDNPGICNVFE